MQEIKKDIESKLSKVVRVTLLDKTELTGAFVDYEVYDDVDTFDFLTIEGERTFVELSDIKEVSFTRLITDEAREGMVEALREIRKTKRKVSSAERKIRKLKDEQKELEEHVDLLVESYTGMIEGITLYVED